MAYRSADLSHVEPWMARPTMVIFVGFHFEFMLLLSRSLRGRLPEREITRQCCGRIGPRTSEPLQGDRM